MAGKAYPTKLIAHKQSNAVHYYFQIHGSYQIAGQPYKYIISIASTQYGTFAAKLGHYITLFTPTY